MKLILTSIVLLIAMNSFSQITPNYIKLRPRPIMTADTGLVPVGFLSDKKLKVDIIGGAAILEAISSGSGATQGTGATGISFYNGSSIQGSVLFTLGSNTDIKVSDNGKNGGLLLIPGNGAQSLQLEYKQFGIFKANRLGFNFSFLGASGNWKLNDTSYSVNPISAKAQLSFLQYQSSGRKANIMVAYDLGMTYRGFIGDASTSETLKESIFGVKNSHFFGIEANVHLWLNDTHFYFNLPILFGPKVSGLTNGQIAIGAAVNGRMLKDIL